MELLLKMVFIPLVNYGKEYPTDESLVLAVGLVLVSAETKAQLYTEKWKRSISDE